MEVIIKNIIELQEGLLLLQYIQLSAIVLIFLLIIKTIILNKMDS